VGVGYVFIVRDVFRAITYVKIRDGQLKEISSMLLRNGQEKEMNVLEETIIPVRSVEEEVDVAIIWS
jgi:hypothetical protein